MSYVRRPEFLPFTRPMVGEEEIAEIIAGVTNKARVGVCIDTAHVHGAGYDIRTQSGWDAMMDRFNAIVGLQYLRGIHVNDSKVELGSRVDRHAPIGRGRVGIEGFRALSTYQHRVCLLPPARLTATSLSPLRIALCLPVNDNRLHGMCVSRTKSDLG